MLCQTSSESKSERRFRSCLKPYLKTKNCRSAATTVKRRNSNGSSHSILPNCGTTHLFNHDAMIAASHAIEDLAQHTASGELIATFQHINNFLPQSKRYQTIAQRIDSVRVWAEGNPPPRTPSIDFVPIFHPELTRYWVVLFESEDVHAVLFCKQANHTQKYADKVFSGFYSFNPFLVSCLRRRFALLACGIEGVIAHFERHFAPQMPDPLEDFDFLLTPA